MKKYRAVIIITILVAIAVVYYYYISLSNKTENKNSSSKVNELEKILNKDLDNSYPATPREVVDLYSRILSCYYSEKMSEEELSKLVEQSRKMFDEELLNANPIEDYMVSLKEDIANYKKSKSKISTYVVENSADIDYKTFQSHYYAAVDTVYYVKGNDGTSRTFETYTLRKDSNGKWKILYWKITAKSEEE